MNDNTIGTFNVRYWHKDDANFEVLRQFAMNDETNTNWYDFIHKRLVIEDHVGYGCLFKKHNDEPVTMCGLYGLNEEVGRVLNRHYVFPNHRNKCAKEMIDGLHSIRKLILEPFMEMSDFKVHIMSMPNRDEGRNNFFNAFYYANQRAWDKRWHMIDGYIQTGANPELRRCWQNAFCDNPNYKFKVITHDEWLKLK